jgi:CBS domain-containing protein
MKTCRDIMFENPACCLPDDNVDMIAQRMAEERIDAFLVVQSYSAGKLVGIVTDNDIALKLVGERRNSTETSVQDIMTYKPITCYASDDIELALERMDKAQIRRLPVVDEELRLIGMIVQAHKIQARVRVQFDNQDNVVTVSVKEDFEGWRDFAERIYGVARQIAGIRHLSDLVQDSESGRNLSAGSASASVG